MMKSSSTTTMFLLLVSLQAMSSSCAFSVSPNARSSVSTSQLLASSIIDSTRLFYRDGGDFDNEILPTVTSSSSSIQSVVATRALSASVAPSVGLSPLEVPARSSDNKEDSSVADQIEMTLGRLSMVAAIMFLGTELITGQSFPEQIITLISQQH